MEKLRLLPIVPTTTRMSWFVYVVRFTSGIDRNLVIEDMAKAGIPTRPYFTPIHLQPFYRERFGFKPGDFPESEAAGAIDHCASFSHEHESGRDRSCP